MKKWLLFLAIAIAVSFVVFFQQSNTRVVMIQDVVRPKSVPACELPAARTPAAASAEKVWGRTPIEVTRDYLEKHKDDLKLQPHHELHPEVLRTPIGSRVVYDVFQDGVPVYGMGIRFRLDDSLSIVDIESDYRPIEKADMNGPSLAAAEIAEEASGRYRMNFSKNVEKETARVIYAHPASLESYPALVIPMNEQNGSRSFQMLFRERDGQLLARTQSRKEF